MENRFKELPEWMKGYLAGIIDGEGTIGMRYQKDFKNEIDKYRPRLQIKMTAGHVLATIRDNVGIGSICVEQHKEKGWKDAYILAVYYFADIFLFLLAIKPYLILKKENAELIIEFIELKLEGNLTISDCIRIQSRLKELNKRGT